MDYFIDPLYPLAHPKMRKGKNAQINFQFVCFLENRIIVAT
jgi:hypothetical protein